MGVEPTIRAAKDRIAGFEGREGHRTLFASTGIIGTSGGAFNPRRVRTMLPYLIAPHRSRGLAVMPSPDRVFSPLRYLRGWLSPSDPVSRADLIFALAGRQSRKEYALELFRQGLAPRILLSVSRFEIRRFSKLALPVPLDLLALARTVPPAQRHYFVEFEGQMFHVKQLRPGRFGTLTEIASLAHWLKGHPEVASILIVSSSSHLRRIRMCCRALLHEGVVVRLAAVPASSAGSGPRGLEESTAAVLKELLKLPVYWMVLQGKPGQNSPT